MNNGGNSHGQQGNTLQGMCDTLKKMTPDILAVIEATLINPATGVAEIIRRVVARAKSEADAG